MTTAFVLDNGGVFLRFLAGSRDLHHLLSVQINSGAHPASYWGAPCLFERKWSSRGVNIDHSPSSGAQVRVSGAIPPFPMYAPVWFTQGQIHHTLVRWRNTDASLWKLDSICGEVSLCKWNTKTYNILKNNAFWYVMPCRRVEIYRNFGGVCNLLLRTTASLFLSAYKGWKFVWNVDKFLTGCMVSRIII